MAGRKHTRLLIDADVLRYQLAFANTDTVVWDEGEEAQEIVHADRAKVKLEEFVADLMSTLKATDFTLLLTNDRTFRHDLSAEYKANRSGRPKPALWYRVDDFLYELWPDRIMAESGIEADDLMGILSSAPADSSGQRQIIVSIDKDMQTIPGWFYNPRKRNEGLRKITKKQADRFWMTQVLTGDTVDNYKGCPGIGPVKAEKILSAAPRRQGVKGQLRAYWEAVVHAFESKGLKADDALLQAQLARILRYGDYNFETREVNLWLGT